MSQKEAPRPRVDVHTHLGLARTHVNDPLLTDSVRAWGTLTWDVTPEQHRSACRATEATVVVAFLTLSRSVWSCQTTMSRRICPTK